MQMSNAFQCVALCFESNGLASLRGRALPFNIQPKTNMRTIKALYIRHLRDQWPVRNSIKSRNTLIRAIAETVINHYMR